MRERELHRDEPAERAAGDRDRAAVPADLRERVRLELVDLEVDERVRRRGVEAVLVVACGRVVGGDHDDRRDRAGGDLGVERHVDLPAGVAEAAVVVVPHVLAVVHEQHGIRARCRGVVARRQVRRHRAAVAERRRARLIELDEMAEAGVRRVEHAVACRRGCRRSRRTRTRDRRDRATTPPRRTTCRSPAPSVPRRPRRPRLPTDCRGRQGRGRPAVERAGDTGRAARVKQAATVRPQRRRMRRDLGRQSRDEIRIARSGRSVIEIEHACRSEHARGAGGSSRRVGSRRRGVGFG